MKILVAGGQGQVGSELAIQGRRQQLDVVALGRAELDVTKVPSIVKAFDRYEPDLLINASAYTSVNKAEKERDLAYAVNDIATKSLASACASRDIPMLHVSTDYVFDGEQKRPYSENDAIGPLCVYGASKEAGEVSLREELSRHIILRTSWVFGSYGTNFVKTVIGLAKEQKKISVVDDQFGGPTSSHSIAQVLLRISAEFDRLGQVPWGTYHFCQTPYVSWFEFAIAIIEYAKEIGAVDDGVQVNRIPSTEYTVGAHRPSNSRLATAKIDKWLKYENKAWSRDLKELIEKILRHKRS